MAKTQIHNYVFKPGIGLLDNLYPNAWNLLTKNKNFLLSEYKEYLNAQIADAEINRRDVGLIIDGAAFDVALDTTYNAVFFKNTRNYLIAHNTTMDRNNTRVKNKILTLSDVSSSSIATSRTNTYFTSLSSTILNGKDDNDSIVFTNPSSAPAVNIAAKDQLIANKNFIAEEVNAYIAANNPNDQHDDVGCKRDIKFVINALAYDVLYGGSSGVNSAIFDLAKYCFYNFDTESSNILPIHRTAAIAAFTRFSDIIDDIVKGVSISVTSGHSATQDTSSAATSEVISTYLVTLVNYIKDIISATNLSAATTALNNLTRTTPTISLWANTELQNANTTINNNRTNILDTQTWLTDYRYTNTEINSKIDTALDTLAFNFRYGGNESLLDFVQKYWDGSVSQLVGNRVPESDVYSWIGETVTNNIFTNTAYSHTGNVTQTIDTSYTSESNASSIFSGYIQNIVDTVFKGLDSAPTLILDGVGYVKLPIDYNITDFLIITNLKDNSVIYNFTNNQTGGKVTKTTPLKDNDFPTFVENSSTITKLELNYNTNSQTTTDQLQIFVENTENNESVLFTTPSGIGQDIVGKARISQSTTIDQTDFEYGMQEEKWNNISLQQSYPSIYEKSQIPIKTTSITTDVSINSDKIGSSLITVNTNKQHNLIVGDAVNVNYLTNTITNTGAAEGTFIINSVPSTTSFTYYAKNKVGNDTEAANTNNYSADFTVVSDSGFLYVNGQTQWNRTIIAGTPTVYNTQIRYNGSVIVDTNDDTFFQQGFYQLGNDRYIFGTVTASASGTTSHQVKKQVVSSFLNIAIPQTIVKKSDFFTGGNLENVTIAVDSVGIETTSTSSLVTPIGNRHYPFTGTIPTLGAPANVYYATNQLSATITTTSGSSTITTTDTSNFSVGAQVSATGIASNSIVKTIGTTGPNYSITLSKNATATGSSVSATIIPKTIIGQVTSLQTTGSSGGIYVNPVLTKDAAIGDTKLTFSDTNGIIADLALDRGDGKAIFVQSIDGNDVNLSAPITTALTGNEVLYTNIKGTNVQHNGIGAIFNVAASGTNYTITISTAGQDYAIGDRLKILGTTIGGLSPANDLFIIVDTINGSGGITAATPSGTPFNGSATISGVSGIVNGGSGASATFDITYLDNAYTNVVVNQNGSGYTVNDKIVIVGNSFTGGVTYTNDLVITVTGVDGSGAITAITSTGVAPNNSVSFTNPAFTTSGSGTASSFVVQNIAGVYSVSFTTTNNFNVADTIIIQGSNLGGQNTTNNLTISVNTVDATGSILTFSTLGSGINGTTVTGKSGNNLTGTGSKFTVSMNAGSYTNPIITNTGSNFAVGQIIKILGTSLMGSTPLNDLLLTVDSINSSRQLTGVSVQSGTALTAITSYNTVATVNDTITGNDAKFSITRTATAYSAIAERSGQNYAVGNKIKINGAHLGGSSTTHDLILRVVSITAGGGIVLNSTAALNQTYSAVATGSTLNFLSTFTTSEPLIAELPTSSIINFDKLTSFIGTTETPHGLVPGNSIVNFSQSHTSSNKHDLSTLTTNIHSVPTDKTFKYFARTTGTVDESLTFPDQITTRYNTTTDFYKESVVNFGGSTTNQIEIKWDGQTILLVNQLQNTTVYNGIINNNYEYTLNGIKYKRGSSQVTGANVTEYQVQQIVPVKSFGDPINGRLFVKNNSTFSHIPQSSSVAISTGGPEYGAQAIRQTKDYFKYQPGKSMFFNTAVLFAPNYSVKNITAEATAIDSIITVTVDNRMHGLQKGCTIRISGISAEGYNSGPDTGVDNESDYNVLEIIDDKTFTIKAIRPLGSTTPIIDSSVKISVVKWNGASVRTGIYTDQDGIFWEYDGDKLVTTLRSSANPLTGSVNINKKTSLVTGTNTKFTDQLCAGDSVVIKGMTHTVYAVSSDTEFSISPQWRGVNNLVDEKIYKVVDHRVTQNNFNIDKLDGTGPSGYNIDISQIQMIAVQYNWNGGGSVEYLIQGVDGTYITVHRTRNANIKNQVYMRTANLPVRYESINVGPRSKLKSALTNNSTSVVVNNSLDFPSTGILLINNELIEYRSNDTSTNTLGNCVRAAKLKYYHAGSLRSYTGSTASAHTAKTGVRFVSQTAHPVLNHWTSNYQVDGNYDVDNKNNFSYAIKQQEITQNKSSKFMLRLAPSLSNNLVGDIGERDLLNYKKLQLDNIEIETHSLYTKKSGEVILTDAGPPIGSIAMRNAHNLNINEAIRFLTTDGSATTMGNIKADGTIYFVKRILNTTQVAVGLSYSSPTLMTQVNATGAGTGFLTWESVPEYTDNIIIEGVLNPDNYLEVDNKIAWTNLNGIPEGKQKSVAQIAFGESIDWKSNITAASTVNVATAADVLTTGAGSAGFVYTAAQSTKNSPIAIASSQIRSLGSIPIGAKIISQNPDAFSNTTTEFYVKYITTDSDNTYLHYQSIDPANNRGLSKQLLDHTSTPATTFKFEYKNYIGKRTNKLLFLKTAWDTGARKVGDKISNTDLNWPIDTKISSVTLLKMKDIEFYEVTFNNNSVIPFPSTGQIIFETGVPNYAYGGQIIFQGTTMPGKKLHLDLSDCNVLVNSPVGSNKTYPDGPDTLVINTSKPSGNTVVANITLNWKEI